jgi:hypothetical protein
VLIAFFIVLVILEIVRIFAFLNSLVMILVSFPKYVKVVHYWFSFVAGFNLYGLVYLYFELRFWDKYNFIVWFFCVVVLILCLCL